MKPNWKNFFKQWGILILCFSVIVLGAYLSDTTDWFMPLMYGLIILAVFVIISLAFLFNGE